MRQPVTRFRKLGGIFVQEGFRVLGEEEKGDDEAKDGARRVLGGENGRHGADGAERAVWEMREYDDGEWIEGEAFFGIGNVRRFLDAHLQRRAATPRTTV